MRKLVFIKSKAWFVIFFSLFATANIYGQSHQKVAIGHPAADSSAYKSKLDTIKQNKSTSKKCFLKKKKKPSPSSTGFAHPNPSDNEVKLDSIKAIKNKEKNF
ncbi:MAG: hypothetical protein KA797_04425 [Chitinophagales bacterium]|nr:hypothetical protein [Chitinophagales bacterium]